MKKVLGLLVLMTVFGLGFGAGQYFHDSGLEVPGPAMASSKPTITSWHATEFTHPNAPHQWGVFIYTDRPIDAVEKKTSTKAALYFK
ncbi:MAG: hypothetical protein PVG60_10325 [Desulfarculaceae bacterium]|jgi:hypothetical protein